MSAAGPVGTLKRVWQRSFQAWLKRRLRPARHQQLHRHNLFIFPTATGGAYLALVLLIWLAGTNYENNLILALAFFLIALFVVAIIHTFANLAGLRIEQLGADPCCAGATTLVHLQLQRRGRAATEQLALAYPGAAGTVVDVAEGGDLRISVAVRCGARGRFRPGRLRLQSEFPLGLLRCWTWLDLDVDVLVYPHPIASPLPPLRLHHDAERGAPAAADSDDFYGFRHWQMGESPAHVAWKIYARRDEMLARLHTAPQAASQWLDWAALSGMDREARLSRLCWWVLQLAQRAELSGLSLPELQLALAPGQDPRPLLEALALFEWHAPAGYGQ